MWEIIRTVSYISHAYKFQKIENQVEHYLITDNTQLLLNLWTIMITSSSETTQDEDEETSAWYVGKIFEPLLPDEGRYSTRSSSANALAEEVSYANLEGESLFGSEMEWAGKFILNKQIEERSAGRDYGAQTFASRYNLKSSTVQSWVQKVKCGSTFYDSRGKTPCIDETGMSVIRNTIIDG